MNMLSSLLDTTWAEALGWTLLHSLWQGVIWVALLRLGTYLLKGRPAQYRYALTLLSVFGLAMTAILTFIQGYQSSVGVAKGFELLPAEAKTYIWAASDLGAGGTWWEVMTNQINAIAPWLTGAWLLGLGLFLIRWIGAYFHVQELRYREAKPMNYHWQDRINELGRQIGIRRTVLLIESRRVSGPLSLGHFKPVVLVPMGLFTGLSPVQIEAILAHELAHIRRHDYLINLMVSLLEVVFFYHPAMWYLFREVSQAREHCCDDLAVATCGSAMDYAKTLAWLAENPSSKVSLASGMGGKRQDLLHRIKRLLTPQQIPGNPGKAALALVLLLSMTTLAWLSPDLNEDADKNFVQRILEGPIGNQLPWFYEKPAQTEAPVPANLSTPTLPVASVAPQNWAGSWNQANCIVVMPLDSPPPNLPMIAPAPPPPPMPAPPVIGEDFNPAQTQAAWEAYGRQMENWGKELGNLQSEYGQRYAESMEEYAEAMQEWAETEAARQSEAFEEDYKVRELERRVQRIHEANVLNQERALRDLERSSRLEKMSKQELRRVQMEMELAMKALEQVNGDQSVDQAKIQQAQRKIERAQKEIEEAMQKTERELSLRHQQNEEEAINEIMESRRQQLELRREAEENARERYRTEAEEARARAEELREQAQKVAEEQRAYAEIAREEARAQAEKLREELKRSKMRLEVERLRMELVEDGIIKNGETRLVIKSSDGSLKINGTKLKGDQYTKYRRLLKQMGVEIGKGKTISITHN